MNLQFLAGLKTRLLECIMEQESAHMLGVGYLKGWKEAGVDIVLGIVSQLDNASKVLHGYTSGIPEKMRYWLL